MGIINRELFSFMKNIHIIIDADYRGEIRISLHNHSGQCQTLTAYERVAQMIIVPYVQEPYEEVDCLDETARGSGGFGSTGRT